MRTSRNQNLSKRQDVLKYGFFDISSMSTKGFWLTYVKTSLFVYIWDINAIFLQISFVPYLTSACPAHRLFKTGSNATAAGGGVRELSEWQRSADDAGFSKPRKIPGTATGKLVGAVTHVLVNDPTTGYGIFIENMLDAAA